ncbi:MAG TPA: histidine kinase [Chitinophagaceae bacterium]|nr:histidine kinase [Chitinophagaceae bacterium]
MPERHFHTISKKQLITGIVVFWVTLGLAYFFMPILEDRMVGKKDSNIGLYLIFNLGWLIWGLLTPLMIYLARKIPIFSGGVIYKNILKHLLIGILLVVAEFIIEYGLEVGLANDIYHIKRDINNFFYGFLYKFHTYLILYFLIVFIIQSIEYMKNYKATVEKNAAMQSQLVKAQLLSLKTQIQPHFLFNTHNTIMSLILKGENEKAAGMITALSTLLRSSLDYAENDFTTVAKEMKIVACYLDIHKIRFEDRLSILYRIDPNTENLSIPSFLLQPIIENAMVHGIAPFKQDGNIEITASADAAMLTIQIKDNGQSASGQVQEGIGISNTRKRLAALFGEQNFLFDLRKDPGKGSVSIIQFPAIPYN